MKTASKNAIRKPKRNVLGLFVFVCALVFLLIGVTAQAGTLMLKSDTSWKALPGDPPDPPSNDWLAEGCPGTLGDPGPLWTQLGFDDSAWANSTSVPSCSTGWTPEDAMWMDNALEVFFRKTFVLPSVPTVADTLIYVDDNYQLYVNGIFVYRGMLVQDWDVFDIAPYLQVGDNVIAIHAWDGGNPTDDEPCKIYWRMCRSITVYLTSDRPNIRGNMYDKDSPQQDTFYINRLCGCDGLADALVDLNQKMVHIEVGPFTDDVPGDQFKLLSNLYYQYNMPSSAPSDPFLKYRFFKDGAGSIFLYGSKVILDGITNPITIRVDIGDWSCEDLAHWREYHYSTGIKYRRP